MSEKPSRKTVAMGDPDAFLRNATRHLSRLSRAARELIESLPAAPQNAAALTRELGVRKKTGWQLFRLAEVKQPLEAVRFIPGQKPLRNMVETARAKGVAGAVADELVAAMTAFERFQLETAGDTASFVAMLGTNTAPSDAADVDRQHRLNAFKTFTHFCGMHVDQSQDLDFLHEDPNGKRHHVHVRTVRGLRRFRPDAECVVDSHRTYTSDPTGRIVTGPLDPKAFREFGVPVVPQFCSRPLPDLVVSYNEQDADQMYVEWAGDKVGLAGAVDVCTGLRRDLNIGSMGGKKASVNFNTLVGYPAKRMTRTWLLRVPHLRMLPPVLHGYLDPAAFNSAADAERSPKMYADESIAMYPAGAWRHLPKGIGIDREQITYVCATMGWDPSDFTLYHLDLEYPLMHSVLSIDLPWKE